MYITQEQYVKRIEREKVKPRRYTTEDRVALGVLTNLEGAEVAADILDASKTIAKNSARGLVRTNFDPTLATEVKERVKQTVDTVRDKLLDGIAAAVDSMTKGAEGGMKPIESSIAAKNLAEVFDKISDRSKNDKGADSKVQILINNVAQKSEKDYETIVA